MKQEGDTVVVDEVLGVLDERVASTAAPAQATTSTSASAAASGQVGQKVPTGPLPSTDGQRPPSPLARRIAEDHNVDISQVKGNSPHGRVVKDDVISYMEQQRSEQQQTPATPVATSAAPVASAAPAPQVVLPTPATPTAKPQLPLQPATGGREERVRLSRRRQTIAQRLVEAQHTAAMLTTFNEIDMSAVMEIRSRRKIVQRAACCLIGLHVVFHKSYCRRTQSVPALECRNSR